jgi:hypothetical protein
MVMMVMALIVMMTMMDREVARNISVHTGSVRYISSSSSSSNDQYYDGDIHISYDDYEGDGEDADNDDNDDVYLLVG